MRKVMFVAVAILLLAGFAMAQNVIKYEMQGLDGIAIGTAVQTSIAGVISPAVTADAVIGFVAAVEALVGPNDYYLIVNAGRLGAIADGVGSAAWNAGVGLTLDPANAGLVQEAVAGDRVIAYATAAHAALATSADIIIQLGPITGANGSKIWQAATAAANLTAVATDLVVNTGANCNVQTIAAYYSATVDDRDGSGTGDPNGGAVITATMGQAGGNGITPAAPTATVYLVDRDFYQQTTVSLNAVVDVDPTDNVTVTVSLVDAADFKAGRVQVGGVLTLVGTER